MNQAGGVTQYLALTRTTRSPAALSFAHSSRKVREKTILPYVLSGYRWKPHRNITAWLTVLNGTKERIVMEGRYRVIGARDNTDFGKTSPYSALLEGRLDKRRGERYSYRVRGRYLSDLKEE